MKKKLVISIILSFDLLFAVTTPQQTQPMPVVNKTENQFQPLSTQIKVENQKINNQNADKDIKELEKIAKDNPFMSDINYMIGIYYMAGDVKKNIKPDFNKAMLYLKKDENNIAIANYKIGELYYYGYGVPQNYNTAIEYFKRASNKKFKDYRGVAPIATLAIGETYMQKLHDFESAAPYLLQAADEFNKPEAQMTLAFLYYEGKGIGKNEDEANKWINRAYFNKDTTADMKAYMSNFIESVNSFNIESDVKNSCGMLR